MTVETLGRRRAAAHRIPWRRVGLFIGLPALSALSPLLVIPSITHALGANGWASFAVGQSLGGFASLLTNFGWSTLGPGQVASGDAEQRKWVYRCSMATRGMVSLIALPAIALLAAAIAPSDPLTAASAATASAAVGLLPTWYFIGAGQPLAVAYFDTLPRLGAAVVAALALQVVRAGWVYGLALGLAVFASVALASRSIIGSHHGYSPLPIRSTLRGHALLVGSSMISGGYTSLSTSIVAVIVPAQTALYAAGFRFRDLTWTALIAVTNATQGWVSESEGEDRLSRQKVALTLNLAAGVMAAIALVAVLPLVDQLLFSGTVEITWQIGAILGGVAVAGALSMSTTYHVLGPGGKGNLIALSGTVAALVGTAAVVLGALTLGAGGALLGVLVSEALNASLQGWFSRRRS